MPFYFWITMSATGRYRSVKSPDLSPLASACACPRSGTALVPAPDEMRFTPNLSLTFRPSPPLARLAVRPQHPHPFRVEPQFLQRMVQPRLARAALDIGVEFGRGEAAAALIAF